MPQDSSISVAIITYNEAHHIHECIQSAIQLGPVTVVDAYSTDQTAAIATESGATVIQRKWTHFSDQKQFAVDACENDWVLVLDADERLTSQSVLEIKTLDLSDPTVAFALPRNTFFLGRLIKHCGWRPDHVIRLFNRTKVAFNQRPVHEAVEGYRSLQHLANPMHHFSYITKADVTRKIEQYSRLGATNILNNKRPSQLSPFIHAGWSFVRTYIFKVGILDGRSGLDIAVMNARTTYLKYSIARQLMAADTPSR